MEYARNIAINLLNIFFGILGCDLSGIDLLQYKNFSTYYRTLQETLSKFTNFQQKPRLGAAGELILQRFLFFESKKQGQSRAINAALPMMRNLITLQLKSIDYKAQSSWSIAQLASGNFTVFVVRISLILPSLENSSFCIQTERPFHPATSRFA